MDVEAEVRMSKSGGGDKGCTISLIGCGASGAYAPGPDDEEGSAMKEVLVIIKYC